MSNEDTRKLLEQWREGRPQDRFAHLVRDTSRALVRGLQMRLNEHDVSFGHWAFLRVLWFNDGLTQRELSEQVGVTEPTAYTTVKAMEQLGYIERRRLPGNKKNVHVFLTPLGRSLEQGLIPLAEEVNRVAVEGLTVDDVMMARKVMLTMLSNLAKDEELAESRDLRVPSTRDLAKRHSAKKSAL